MIKRVEEYIRKYNMIEAGDEVVAGVSGGADSVCMLLNLLEYQKGCEFELKVVHINHLIREDASEDAQFVKELCDKNSIPFFLFEEDVEKQAKELGLSIEEAGRRIRYLRFDQVAVSDRFKIAVAHNSNDVAETVLFNMFRGTGLEGLASLLPVNGNIIRPLLCVSRNDIEQYLREVNQTYKTDSTNAHNDYARNKIRNVILPFAEKEIVSGSSAHVAALSEKMMLVREYIGKEATAAYEKTVTDNNDEKIIELDEFNRLDNLLKNEVVLLALEKLTSGRKDIGQIHVDSIMGLLDRTGTKRIDLPYGLEAVKQYDRLLIHKRNETDILNFEYIVNPNEAVTIMDKRFDVRIFPYEPSMVIPQNAYTKWFDYDKINECPVIRNRRKGDYLTVNKELQKKSLKDYMIDCKIPKQDRDKVIIVADGSHVIWAVGYRISEYYKVSDNTKRIIEISVE